MDYFEFLQQYPALFNNHQAAFQIVTDPAEIAAWEEHKRQELSSQSLDPEWAKIGLLLADPYVLVLRDLVKTPDQKAFGYLRVIDQAALKGGEAVVVLPVMAEQILLLHQYRHATRQWHYEIPRGFGTPGMPAVENARKEVQEEVEGIITNLVDLGIMYPNTGLERNHAHLFFAAMERVGKPAEDEGIERIHWVSIAEMERMIRDGEITDGFTLAAFTRAKLKGLI